MDKKQHLTAGQIAELADNITIPCQNRAAINKLFRKQDDSNLYPICNDFNVTERSIKRAQKFNRETGNNIQGLEYALWLEADMSEIVNNYI